VWGGITTSEDNDLSSERFNIIGYPGDKPIEGDPSSGDEMWGMEHTIKKVETYMLRYEHDTFKGQSGSPIWRMNSGCVTIVGVHTGGQEMYLNKGVRITKNIIEELLIQKIEETYTLVPSNQNSPSKKKEDTQEVDSKEHPPSSQEKRSFPKSTVHYGSKETKVFEQEVIVEGNFVSKPPDSIKSAELQGAVEAVKEIHKQMIDKNNGKADTQTNLGNEKTTTFKDKVTIKKDFNV